MLFSGELLSIGTENASEDQFQMSKLDHANAPNVIIMFVFHFWADHPPHRLVHERPQQEAIVYQGFDLLKAVLTANSALYYYLMSGCPSLCISQLLTLRTLPVQSDMHALYINEHSVLVIIHVASMLVLSFLLFVSILTERSSSC